MIPQKFDFVNTDFTFSKKSQPCKVIFVQDVAKRLIGFVLYSQCNLFICMTMIIYKYSR